MKQILILIMAVAALAACTEQTQTIDSGNRPDTAAFQGTGTPFAAPGWKPGDKISWEQQLKTRTQNGQNDYAKVN
ncbi:MAG TPA: hypothetical protein VN667_05410 [Burkholderiales bacterium]|nr:hypothetical protein [Burkholderiales bacterium]